MREGQLAYYEVLDTYEYDLKECGLEDDPMKMLYTKNEGNTMELWKYVGEKVRILNTDKEVFEGDVSDYIYPEDNEPEEIESIILDHLVREDGHKFLNSVEFTASEIESIKIML